MIRVCNKPGIEVEVMEYSLLIDYIKSKCFCYYKVFAMTNFMLLQNRLCLLSKLCRYIILMKKSVREVDMMSMMKGMEAMKNSPT